MCISLLPGQFGVTFLPSGNKELEFTISYAEYIYISALSVLECKVESAVQNLTSREILLSSVGFQTDRQLDKTFRLTID